MTNIFKIKREERWPSAVALLVFVLLNGLLFYKYGELFLKAHHVSFWESFGRTFHVSGFDDWSYCFLSNGKLYFEIMRHPLFAVILYPFYALNKWLISAGDTNYAMFIMATLAVLTAYYSFIFLYRIFREIIGVSRTDSLLLTAFFYGFGMVMVTVLVPDHFVWSLFLLTMTLYLAGLAIKDRRKMAVWQVTLLGFLTGGVTLSNFVKTYLAAWFVNGRHIFGWRYIATGIASLAVLLGTAWLLQTEVREGQIAAETRVAEKMYKKNPERQRTDSIHHAKVLKATAKPMHNEGLLKWTDESTSRTDALMHNMFGESIQLHDSHLLQDLVMGRPAVVKYTHTYNYIVEGLIALLFLLGVLVALRNKFFLMVLSWFGFDMLLHFGLGFGLNEMYIMTAHWAFIVPIAVAYLLRDLNTQGRRLVRWSLSLLTLFLWAWNGWLLWIFMSEQVTKAIKYFT